MFSYVLLLAITNRVSIVISATQRKPICDFETRRLLPGVSKDRVQYRVVRLGTSPYNQIEGYAGTSLAAFMAPLILIYQTTYVGALGYALRYLTAISKGARVTLHGLKPIILDDRIIIKQEDAGGKSPAAPKLPRMRAHPSGKMFKHCSRRFVKKICLTGELRFRPCSSMRLSHVRLKERICHSVEIKMGALPPVEISVVRAKRRGSCLDADFPTPPPLPLRDRNFITRS